MYVYVYITYIYMYLKNKHAKLVIFCKCNFLKMQNSLLSTLLYDDMTQSFSLPH